MDNSRIPLLGAVTTVALAVPCLTAHAVDPQILRVDSQAAGLETGLSWENAFATLSGCLEYVAGVPEPPEEGWQIWVALGTYVPSPEALTFSIPNNVAIYGGFQGHETVRQQRDPEAYGTVLSGEFYSNTANTPCGALGAGSCFTPHGEPGCSWTPCCEEVCSIALACCQEAWDEICVAYALTVPECEVPPNAPHVVSATTPGLNRRVDGFTITKGGSQEPGQQIGVTGAGILITRGSLRVVRCIITGNRAERGGGFAIEPPESIEEPWDVEADGQIWNCSILSNRATTHGAGIFALGNVTYTIANSEIAENRVEQNELTQTSDGGGMWEAVTVEDNARVVANCTIVRNMAGGILQPPVIVEPAFAFTFPGDLTVVNSIIRNNYVDWSEIDPTVPVECEEPCTQPDLWGEAILINCLVAFSDDPVPANFINCINAPPGLTGIDVGDYRLAEGSPCIDAGDDGLLVFLVDTFDVNDNANDDEIAPDRRLRKRVQPAPGQTVARVDIGAHEHYNAAWLRREAARSGFWQGAAMDAGRRRSRSATSRPEAELRRRQKPLRAAAAGAKERCSAGTPTASARQATSTRTTA